MQIQITSNQAQAGITPSGGNTWNCYYNTPQRLTIQVTAEAGDLGQTFGLSQTLVASTRTANYATGGQQTCTPNAGLPCLDGDNNLIPWYNAMCAGRSLEAPGSIATFELEDSPLADAPSQVRDPDNNIRNIQTLDVAETFLVTLYNLTTQTPIMQWNWFYNYRLVLNQNNIFATPLVEAQATSSMQVQNPPLPIVVEGPVAIAGSTRTLTPGWSYL